MPDSTAKITASDKQPTPGIYKHYRGGLYEVLFVATHTESLEDLVVYRALYDSPDMLSSFWVRPRDMFLELVTVDGNSIPRFTKENAA